MHVCSLRWKRRSNALTYIFLIKTYIYCPPERLEPDCAIFANRLLHNFSVNGQKNAYSIYDSDIGKGYIKIQKSKSFPSLLTQPFKFLSHLQFRRFLSSKPESPKPTLSSVNFLHTRISVLAPSLPPSPSSPSLFRQRMSYPLLRDKPRGKRE